MAIARSDCRGRVRAPRRRGRRRAQDRRRPEAHAGRPQPGRDAGEHPLDDLQARLDVDDPPAGFLHRRAEAQADAAVRRDRPNVRVPGDHLISLEMGGNPTDPRNLWPEPYPRAAAMDQIENQLNSEICDGQLTLAQAQAKESQIKHTQG